jgi:hypothetical protein
MYLFSLLSLPPACKAAGQPGSCPKRLVNMRNHTVRRLAIALVLASCVIFSQVQQEPVRPVRIRAFNDKGQATGSAWAIPMASGYACPRSLLVGASRVVLEKKSGEAEVVNAVLGDDPEHNLAVVKTGIGPHEALTPATNPLSKGEGLRVTCGPDLTYPMQNPRPRDLPVFGAVILGDTAHGETIIGCPLIDGADGWRGIVVWENSVARPSVAAVPAEWAPLLSTFEERSWEEWRRLHSAAGKGLRDRLLLEGLEDLWRGNYSGTIRSLSELIEAHPKDGRAWYYRGYAKAMSGDRMGAIDDYEEAVRYDPSNAEAHFSLGFSYLLLKRKLEANEQAKALDDIDAEMAARLRALIGAISEGGRPPAEGPSAQSDSPMTP